jgi:hypothetical protein
MNDKMVPIQFPPNSLDMLEAWTTSDEPNVGWCLLCNRPIESESDLIPETNTHDCPEGRAFEKRQNSNPTDPKRRPKMPIRPRAPTR